MELNHTTKMELNHTTKLELKQRWDHWLAHVPCPKVKHLKPKRIGELEERLFQALMTDEKTALIKGLSPKDIRWLRARLKHLGFKCSVE
ncbi:hypothetical protein HK102_003379, partial [Quaeritorhiza haematococci]